MQFLSDDFILFKKEKLSKTYWALCEEVIDSLCYLFIYLQS